MNELATIAARASVKGIPFLLAGGHAVIVNGFARSTFDLDLIARQSDPEANEIRELFEKHGTAEFYKKVKAACRQG